MKRLYQLKQAGFDYGTDFGLNNINLEIAAGSITSFVGPNGSGKSTLLNLLAFLDLPLRGTFHYRDQLLDKGSQNEFKKSVGYVQQNPYLLRGSVLKNVELGLKLQHVDKAVRLQRVADVMQLMQITELMERSVTQLSGGESQKVAIARVLVLEPQVLILDEPFTFLDKRSNHDLEALIVRLKQDYGKTVILTTHNQLQAQSLSDEVYSVVQGKVIASQLVNLFKGKIRPNAREFDTGRIVIQLPDHDSAVEQIAIDPRQVVLSRDQLDSSMQNCYQGTIVAMVQQNGHIKVTVDAGEEFQVVITQNALHELGLLIGNEVWLSFKSASIMTC